MSSILPALTKVLGMKVISWVMLMASPLVLLSCRCPPHEPRLIQLPSPYYAMVADDGSQGNAVYRPRGPFSNPLPVVPRVQEGAYLCWATCAEMIMEFLGRRVRQCEQASRPGDGELWCCMSDQIPRECDAANYPDFLRWGFASQWQYPQALSWEQVMMEIDQGRPFAFVLRRTQSSSMSHMFIAVGYRQGQSQATRELLCLNPMSYRAAEEETISYADYSATAQNTAIANIDLPDYIHEMVYFGIYWQGATQSSP